MAFRGLKPALAWGIAAFVGWLVIFGMCWRDSAQAYERAEKTAHEKETEARIAEQQAIQGRSYALEIRGVGLGLHQDGQSKIWQFIKKKNDNFASIYSQDAKDYDSSLMSRENSSRIKVRMAFKSSAGEAVAYWPVPAFALGPPDPYAKGYRAAGLINAGRNAATLGVTQFLWQEDENTTHAQVMIERLFTFFDNNPTVPQALIASQDGDVARNPYREPGTPGLQNGHRVPVIYENATGLLVTRSDRVDRYIRPFAIHETEDNQNKNTDLGKLWAFYWDQSNLFVDWYRAAEHAKGTKKSVLPYTMSTAYWQSQLPTLWKTISNRGPGDFEPSHWLPVRWAEHQLKEFDAAPVLGYLHRPIKVSMQNEHGQRLKPALQAKALQAGWLKALDTLPDGQKPVRVFYDTTDNTEAEIALTNALHSLNTDGHGLDVGNVEEGYDIGRRLGNTGVSSALVEINLATIASYLDGGASAVVYAGSDGSLTVQMISPPTEARKAKNAQNRGADPFTYGLPGSGPPST
ncbi:type VI lipase adapter Tla3 domain-containing protein [Pseudomonas alabamensis]|uniref:type VI lipase adapter Tla3 domain-containing protein n=1 Tax=Pseudomonas alabamensis TaxID=3064349 RepID=UPI000A2EFF5F